MVYLIFQDIPYIELSPAEKKNNICKKKIYIFFSSCHSDESAVRNSGPTLVCNNINNLDNRLKYIYLLNYQKKIFIINLKINIIKLKNLIIWFFRKINW